jgi:hypothetical protein
LLLLLLLFLRLLSRSLLLAALAAAAVAAKKTAASIYACYGALLPTVQAPDNRVEEAHVVPEALAITREVGARELVHYRKVNLAVDGLAGDEKENHKETRDLAPVHCCCGACKLSPGHPHAQATNPKPLQAEEQRLEQQVVSRALISLLILKPNEIYRQGQEHHHHANKHGCPVPLLLLLLDFWSQRRPTRYYEKHMLCNAAGPSEA